MPGWITYPIKKETTRQMPVIFIPALHSKWMLIASDLRENSNPAQEKSASLGFYCGPLAGQTSAGYPSLTADLPEYAPAPYQAKFQMTPKLLDPAIRLHVASNGSTGCYHIVKTTASVQISIRGSLPVFPPFLMVRECRYFGFSPYLMNE